MRRLLGCIAIALALAASAGCAAHMATPAAPVAEGTLIWDCGWRTL
jgi:hypothetical protein